MSSRHPEAARTACNRPNLCSEAGSAIIEMALALPVFLMLMLGTFQFAIVLLTFCNATLASSQAARYASLHSSTSLVPAATSQVQSIVTSKLFMSKAITPTVSVNYLTPAGGTGTNVIGNMVTVKVYWSQSIAIPWASNYSFSIGSQDIRVITR